MSAQAVILLPVHTLMIKALLYRECELTKWESKFLVGISGEKYLSAKQLKKLEQIYEGFRGGRQLHFSEVSETWEDVHDFDR